MSQFNRRAIGDRDLRAALLKAVRRGALSWPDTSRVLRAVYGLTQLEFARRTRLTRNTVQMIEAGRISEVAPDALVRIAHLARAPVARIASKVTVALGTRQIVKARANQRDSDLRAVRLGTMSLKELHARNALDTQGMQVGLPKLRRG